MQILVVSSIQLESHIYLLTSYTMELMVIVLLFFLIPTLCL